MRQRLADRCRIQLGAATWRPVAVDLGPIGHVGGRCRPGPVRAAGDLSIAEGRVAASGAAGGKPLGPSPSGQRRASTGRGDAMSLPLEGLLVADFSQVLAGPLAATMLADLGALVIKVERPRVGDDTRRWGPPWTDNSSSYFEAANRSKKSIELDLSDPKDQQLARELARRADVLLENYREGSLARKGLGYDQVAAENPRIVYASITGFGSRGGKRPARVRLPRPGGWRPDEHHRNSGGADEGRRRGGGCAHGEGCGHRHPGGAASPRARRNRATGRGQPAVQPPRVAGQPGLRLPGDRNHTGEHGQPAPVHRSLRNSGSQGRTSRHLLWQ